MLYRSRPAKINIKVLIILTVVAGALGASLFAARQIRRGILSKRNFAAGEAAYEKKDWSAANRYFAEYLGRNPDDVEILKKLAEARLSIRPVEAGHITGAIAAYRRVIQLDPLYETAYDKLAMIYGGIADFTELAYIARIRLEHVASDREARLWLADALVQLNETEEAREILHDFIAELQALPDKHVEYVQACIRMSNIADSDDSPDANTPLEWLNDALEYNPESVEALVHRALFYRGRAESLGIEEKGKEKMLADARKDLIKTDDLGTENPRLRLSLCTEWIAHGDLDQAAAELKAVENLTQEDLEEHFLDIDDWTVSRFIWAAELARLKGATAEGAYLVDEVLTALKEERHRIRVLPSSVGLYVAAGRVVDARECLDEYLDTMYAQEGPAVDKLMLAYLQALVARAEEKPYVVIDVLQPATVNDAARPEIWHLLAEAYSRTDQTRRAVGALIRYLRIYPRDPEMTLQLAREYVKLQDWNNASEITRLAELLNPTEITAKLLRIQASIYLAVEQPQEIDTAKLDELSCELAELRKEHADRVDIRKMQAVIALHLDQRDEAEKELKLAIEECEDSLSAEIQLAGHYYRTKRTTEAVSVCRTACEKHPEVAEPWLFLSGLHVASAAYDSARGCLRQGLDTVVEQREKRSLSLRLALLELMYADRDTGISLLSELAAQDKQEIRARSLLLGTREVREDQATAEKLVSELREAEGESGLLWRMHQASLWLSSDDWRSKQRDITDALRRCINSDPGWSAPVLLLVGMYEKLNDSRRVEDICRQALARNPSATYIANKLLILLEKQGRLSEAEKVLEQIEADARFTGAWHARTALSAGDSSRAIDELKLRASNDNRDAESRILLARLEYSQTGDAHQAFEYLKEAEAIASASMTLTAAKVSILKAEGQAEQAQRILDEYVVNTDAFGAYMMRAAYLANEGEFDSAEKDYRKLTTFAEQGAMGYGLLSNFYARNEKLDQAAEALEEGLDAYPEDLRLKRGLVQLLFMRAQAQDRQKALEILAVLEEELPEDPQLMGLRVLQILEESTPQSLVTAREKLEDIIKLEPTAIDVHLTLIRITMQQRDFETARNLAIRAIGSNPNNLALLSSRGKAELALENTQMAIELAHLVLGKDPSQSEALDVLLDSALRNEDHSLLEEARRLIESAVDGKPADEKLQLLRARVLVALELPQIAITELETFCREEPEHSGIAVFLTLSNLYRLAGDMDQSQLMIEQAKQLDVSSPALLNVRIDWATSLYQQGHVDRAVKVLRELLDINPNDLRVLNNLAWIFQEHYEFYIAALEMVNRGLSLKPDDLSLLGTRGTILENMADRLTDARKDFERLVELAGSGTLEQAKGLLKLGLICGKCNQLAQAEQHLNRALEIDRQVSVFTSDERAKIMKYIRSIER